MKFALNIFIIISLSYNLSAFSGKGSGTITDPYQVTNIEQLQEMNTDSIHLEAHYILMNDIDASATVNWNIGDHDDNPETPDSAMGFDPIGNDTIEFRGSLDGQKYTITGLYINRPAELYIGLFGAIYSDYEIRNMNMKSVKIRGYNCVGSLCGINYKGSIENIETESEIISVRFSGGIVGYNCDLINNVKSEGRIYAENVAGGITGTNYFYSYIHNAVSVSEIESNYDAGGLIGYNGPNTIVANSHATGNVINSKYAGGLIGQNDGCVLNSYATGNVAGDYAGGLIGNNSGFVHNAYATGNIVGYDYAGGLVGECLYGAIIHAYSVGLVEGKHFADAGGLVGRDINQLGDIVACFWNTETSGRNTSARGIGKTTAELKQKQTYIDAGFNFEFIWHMEDDYPYIALNPIYRPKDRDDNGRLDIKILRDLRWLSESGEDFNSDWEMTDDIDASDTRNWNSGCGFAPIFRFSEKFNGMGYTISNLYLNWPKLSYVALFGKAYSNKCEISNLNIVNSEVYGNSYVANLIGYSELVKIHSISAEGMVEGENIVGGLIGANKKSEVKYSTTSGHVTDRDRNSDYDNYYGGLIGLCDSALVTNSSSFSNVTGYFYVGGLIGRCLSSEIKKCYSIDSVYGHEKTAGFIGDCSYSDIRECFTNGFVDGWRSSTGGLIGYCLYCTVKKCCSHGQVFGYSYVGGLIGSSSKSEIYLSYSTSDVSSKENGNCIGGLIGSNGSTVNLCYASGNVIGNAYCGGLVGENGFADVSNSYARGDVTAVSYAGGLIGHHIWESKVNYSYSTGKILGKENIGGLIGFIANNAYGPNYCLWDAEASTMNTSAGGGVGETTANMKNKDIFLHYHWDFDSTWAISSDINDGYPNLQDMDWELAVDEKESANEPDIKLYPNPASEFINIVLPGSEYIETIELTDIFGCIINRIDNCYGLSSYRLSLNGISPGCCFLRIKTGNKIISRPVLVQ